MEISCRRNGPMNYKFALYKLLMPFTFTAANLYPVKYMSNGLLKGIVRCCGHEAIIVIIINQFSDECCTFLRETLCNRNNNKNRLDKFHEHNGKSIYTSSPGNKHLMNIEKG